jgi:hypothetical protein
LTRAPRPKGAASGGANQVAPWSLSDFGRLLRYEVPSLLAVLACFVGARHATSWDAQIYWVVGAMGATVLAGIGWSTWLVVGGRNVRVRQRRLEQAVGTLTARRHLRTVVGLTVTGRGMTRFHRPDCPLTAGRTVTATTTEEHLARSLTPCGVCLG